MFKNKKGTLEKILENQAKGISYAENELEKVFITEAQELIRQ